MPRLLNRFSPAKLLAAGVLLGASFASVGVAAATSPSAPTTFYACYSSVTGLLTKVNISKTATCPTGQLSVSWPASGAVASTSTAGIKAPGGMGFVNGYLIAPDTNLAGAKLSGANLSGANLGAPLVSSQFGPTNLTGADISSANLKNANLQMAKLNSAMAGQADFTGANLKHANFTNADLTGAILIGANLTGATFTGATLTGVTTDSTTICPGGAAGPCTF